MRNLSPGAVPRKPRSTTVVSLACSPKALRPGKTLKKVRLGSKGRRVDPEVGAPVKWEAGSEVRDLDQVVLESEPYRRLS